MTTFARMHPSRLFGLLIPLLWLSGRSGKNGRPVFKLLSPEQTGVTFANTIITNDSLNAQTDVYVYNGAGVGVGDVDNDGLPDIFFAANGTAASTTPISSTSEMAVIVATRRRFIIER